MKLKVAEVVYDEKIYPRDKVDMNIVAQYREAIENLPPILVDKKKRVIDGYHRLLAYRGENIDEIDVEMFGSDDNGECLLESIKRNSTYGKQLTSTEKKRHARTLYQNKVGDVLIIKTLSISTGTFYEFIKDLKKAEKEGRDQKILELYLACHTYEDIEKELEVSHGTVFNAIEKVRNSEIGKNDVAPASLQYTNLWEFDSCDPAFGEVKYPGRMPGQIVENLLWYYTEPFDVVFDPMAGSGTTIDVCKKMYRRYLAFDLNPIESKGIKHNDITKGFPDRKIKDKPKLIILDPPYSIQKKGEYTNIETDLSNLSVDEFYKAIGTIAAECKKEIAENGTTAFIISSLKINGKVIDLAFDCRNIFMDIGFKVDERICVPYNNASSMTGYWIKDAKDNKRMLRAYRDLLIMRL